MTYKTVIAAIMSNGVRKNTEPEARRLIGLINLYFGWIGALLTLMTVVTFAQGNYDNVVTNLIALGVIIVCAFYLRFTGDHRLISYVLLGVINVFNAYWLATGAVANSGHMWVFMLPLLSLFVFGTRMGTASILFFLLMTVILFYGPGQPLLVANYTSQFKFRFVAAFLGITLCAMLAEYSRKRASEHLMQLMEQQRAEVKRRLELEEQLRHSQKMEAVGRLAGGIAHDFNNIVTGILSYSTFVKEELREGGKAEEDLDIIVDAAKRAGDLTSQLLAFGRKQMIRVKVLDLNKLVSDMGKLLRRTIAENIELGIVTDPALGRVKADPNQLEQVIMNLVVNARDAMPDGGKLTISTSNANLDDEYCRAHVDADPGEYVLLTVADTGAGMDEPTKEKIFEPFFTTKKKGRGTGLGLSMVYGIASQNRCNIDVDSSPERGTAISFYIPRVYEARSPSSLPAAAIPVHESKTILIAEDEDIVRKSTVRMLKRSDYHVLEATSGEEALEIAAVYEGRIDLLLTDVIMTGISGTVLAEKLKIVRPETRALYMSGYTEDLIADQAALSDGALFMAKPFTANELLNKVKRSMEGSN